MNKPHHEMDNRRNKGLSNKTIALILGLIAVVWYVASMFTLWQH